MEDPPPDPVAELASARFGVKYLFPLQRLVIANVLDSAERDERLRQIALLPTGFGKSLCFQLPALLLPGPTIAVYPLLALMVDQRRRLAAAGVACAVFRGGMPEGERKEAEEALARCDPEPERVRAAQEEAIAWAYAADKAGRFARIERGAHLSGAPVFTVLKPGEGRSFRED